MNVSEAIAKYTEVVHVTRSRLTWKTYRVALNRFMETLADNGTDPAKTDIADLSENAVGQFAESIAAGYNTNTVNLYLVAVKGFYEYLAAEGTTSPNMLKITQLIKRRSRRNAQRLPQFPIDDIEVLLEAVDTLKHKPTDDPNEHLRNLRDRALILTLADTGLRIHEAVALRRKNIDWQEYHALIIGKGDKQAIVRFSRRSIEAIKDYLSARQSRDGNTGKQLPSLPIFARHDKGAGGMTIPMGTSAGRAIVTSRVVEFLGQEAERTITPHSFRHYFVTRVLASSGNLKLAQHLARHTSIAVTQRYAHLSDSELDAGYYEAIERPSPTENESTTHQEAR